MLTAMRITPASAADLIADGTRCEIGPGCPEIPVIILITEQDATPKSAYACELHGTAEAERNGIAIPAAPFEFGTPGRSKEMEPAAAAIPDMPNGPGLFAVTNPDGTSAVTNVRRVAGTERPPGTVLVALATVLLLAHAALSFFVSFSAQDAFVFAVKQMRVQALAEAVIPDTGMMICYLLALGLARAKKNSTMARVGVIMFSLMSAGQNFLAAYPGTIRAYVVWTLPALTVAFVADLAVSVIRKHAMGIDDEPSAWKSLGRLTFGAVRLALIVALYLLRFILAPSSTGKGLRRMVLAAAPLPADTVEPQKVTKKAVLLALYRNDADYGNRALASRTASRLAPLADLQPGSARTVIYDELDRLELESR
jgi:hypothetical protein